MSGILPNQSLPHPVTPVTSFVGREQEIATVTAMLDRPEIHLLTITGPGGIGKTRLALRVAASVRDVDPNRVAIVALAPVLDPELVLPTVA